MGELKACPFCGGKPKLKDNGKDFNALQKEYYIVCKKCGTFFGNSKCYYNSDKTISAWNRRARAAGNE